MIWPRLSPWMATSTSIYLDPSTEQVGCHGFKGGDPTLFNIYIPNLSFCIFRVWHVHIRKMQNLQITFAYILNNGGQKIFISFLLCVWLAQISSPRLDQFFNQKVFSFNI